MLPRGAGDRVVAVEAGATEAPLRLTGGSDHRFVGEVGEGRGADVAPDLLYRVVRPDKLLLGVHVYAVVAGTRDRRRGDPEVDFRRPGLEEKPDQLSARVPPHDGVVYDDDALALYHRGERVKLEPETELAHPIRRLDKGPAYVAVLYEPLGVGYAASLRVPDRRRDAGVGDRYHDVRLGRSLLGEQLPHPLARPRDLPAVEAGVGAGEVHVLEDAQGGARALAPEAVQSRVVYDNDLAGGDLTQEAGADNVEAAGLAGDGVAALDLADAQGPEAVRVAEGDELVAEDHGHRVGPLKAPHGRPHRLAHGPALFEFLHGGGRDKGRVRGGVELEALPRKLLPQTHGVHQVAVVRNSDVELAAAVELGLGVLPGGRARRRVSDVAQSDVPGLKCGEPGGVEDLRDEAHVTHGRGARAVGDGYPGGLLATVLEGVEAEVRALGQLPLQHTRLLLGHGAMLDAAPNNDEVTLLDPDAPAPKLHPETTLDDKEELVLLV